MTVMEQAELIREAMDAAGAVLSEEQALACVRLYRPWKPEEDYEADTFLTYGVNGVGDPQLYRVVQTHRAQAEWTPDAVPALYTPIGLDERGYPVWSQPTGSHDAYRTGDVVSYQGVLYESVVDGNVYSPEAWPEGWQVVAL